MTAAATVHLVRSDESRNPYDDWAAWEAHVWQHYPAVRLARHGDLVEDLHWSGERAQGVAIVWRRKKRWALWPLATDLDDHGGIPAAFPALTEFPLNYWHLDLMRTLDRTKSGQASQLTWHSEYGSAPWMHVDPVWARSLRPVWQPLIDPSRTVQALASPLSQFTATHGWHFDYKRHHCVLLYGGTQKPELTHEAPFKVSPQLWGVIGTREPWVGLVL